MDRERVSWHGAVDCRWAFLGYPFIPVNFCACPQMPFKNFLVDGICGTSGSQRHLHPYTHPPSSHGIDKLLSQALSECVCGCVPLRACVLLTAHKYMCDLEEWN